MNKNRTKDPKINKTQNIYRKSYLKPRSKTLKIHV